MQITTNKLWTDICAYSIFDDLVRPLMLCGEAHYYWSTSMDVNFFKTKFTKPLVILCIRDLLGDPGITGKFPWVDDIHDMCVRNARSKFIFFHSIEDLSNEFPPTANLQLVRIGGDLLNEIEKYQLLQPVLSKNTNTTKHVINLNRNPRLHRVAVSSYLYGMSVPATITYLHRPTLRAAELLDIVPWDFSTLATEHRSKFVTGYDLLKQAPAQDDYDIYADTHGHSDTIGNFEFRLRPLYENSFVEVITETTFHGSAFMLNEKILQCMVACNFPIVMGSVGEVDFLRQLGFDMFDDIVDNSYNEITDPLRRIVAALELNHRLLTDRDYAIRTWQENSVRFVDNLEVMRTKLVPFYRDRATAEFKTALSATLVG